ncbi:hypothetical protein D4R71_00520 [bacterium]|nr:MAG: hypothetical protein D4R71_00520 [bacterium]
MNQEDWEKVAYKNRQVNRDIAHCIQHIKQKNYELAINILRTALKRERRAKRNGEPATKG